MPKCDALFRECLDIVIRAWTEDPFTYDGEFYRFPVPGWLETNKQFFPLDRRYHAPDGEYIGMYIHPRPYQQPHPPVWLMSNTPQTYGFAGAEGMNVIGMSNPPKKTRQCWAEFQQAASGARQREVGLQHVMLAMPFFGLPFEKVLSSLSRFGEQVLPRFETSASAPLRVAGGTAGR